MLREARLKFTRESLGTLAIRSVSRDGILINGELWSETIAVTPQEIIEPWPQLELHELTLQTFSPLLALSPELILVGTGASGEFPPRELMFAFARSGVGLEVMDTAAAARTFNVLAGEGREIAALLYPE